MERHLKALACVFLLSLVVSLRVVLAADVRIPFVWEDGDPSIPTDYYVVYVSTTQGEFSDPMVRITRLPTESSPLWLTFPADGVVRYMAVRAVNTDGTSELSNEITFTPSLTWQDVQ